MQNHYLLNLLITPVWRYDLLTQIKYPLDLNQFLISVTITFHPPMVSMFPKGSTRINLGTVEIDSALSEHVDMGTDVSLLVPDHSAAIVQDTFITPSNQGTWITFSQDLSAGSIRLGRWLSFTNATRLRDPSTFGAKELIQMLSDHVGTQYGYREDIRFPGGGFQHLCTAVVVPTGGD